MLLYVMLTGVFPFWRKEDEKMDRRGPTGLLSSPRDARRFRSCHGLLSRSHAHW